MNHDPYQTISELIDTTTLALDRLEQLDTLDAIPPDIWYRMAVGGLMTISNRLEDTAKTVGLQGISEKKLTRTAMAAEMHVHPHTVARWLTATEVEAPEERDRNYPPVT